MLSLFTATPELAFLIIPLSVVIAGVFTIMEKTGAVNEDPFENRIGENGFIAVFMDSEGKRVGLHSTS